MFHSKKTIEKMSCNIRVKVECIKMLPIGGAQNPNTSVTELISFNCCALGRGKPQIAAICRSFINCQIEVKYLNIQAVIEVPYRSNFQVEIQAYA
jgi:hypothetical protein